MEGILVSWIGGNDLKGTSPDITDYGPIHSTLPEQFFDRVELLYNYPAKEVKPYLQWLGQQSKADINSREVNLSSPINFGEIYQSADVLLAKLTGDKGCDLHILLSPGTPAMQAVWILLAKTRYSATFWQSSRENGVEQAIVPFDIAAEYVPTADKISSKAISKLATAVVPVDAAFDDIITQNSQMQELKAQATVLAERDVPVLIYR